MEMNFLGWISYLWDRIEEAFYFDRGANMKSRNAVAITIMVMLGIASAGAALALYTNISAKAATQNLPALNNIPADYHFVFGVNVQRLAKSSAYAELRQKKPIGNELAVFIEKTGVDPARDVTYLIGAGPGKAKKWNAGVVIAVGKFNHDAIVSYIRSKSAPVEVLYGGAPVFLIPNAKTGDVYGGITFLADNEIALGNLPSLKAAIDARANKSKSILSDAAMSALLNDISSEEMFWFAGDVTDVIANTSMSAPLAATASSIKNVVGTVDINDAAAATVAGTITLTALDLDRAVKLADTLRGFIALGQLAGNQNLGLKAMLDGLVVTQNSTRVSVALKFPVNTLEKLGGKNEPGIRIRGK